VPFSIASAEALADLLRQRLETHEKLDAPQIFWGTMKVGTTSKRARDVEAVTALAFDLDRVSDDQLRTIQAKIAEARLFAIFHSTHSHPGQRKASGTTRLRILFIPDRPIKLFEWLNEQRGVERELLGGLSDPAARGFDRHFLLPSTAPAEADEHLFHVFDGSAISVDFFLRDLRHDRHVAELVEQEIGTETLSPDLVRDLLDRCRSKNPKVLAGVKAGRLALLGKSYAPAGTREACLFALAGFLARQAPRATATSLAAPFSAAIDHEHNEHDGPSLADFVEKIRRCQRSSLEAATRVRLANERRSAERSARALSPAALEQSATNLGFRSIAELRTSLIIQHHNLYFVWAGTRYVPATAPMVARVVEELIEPNAAAFGVDLSVRDESGEVSGKKSIAQLVSEIGNFANLGDGVRYDFSGRHRYDSASHTLHLSRVKPPGEVFGSEFVPEVDAWLRSFSGEKYDALLDYLSQVPDTTQPLAALILVGPKGLGKTQFAYALAKLWDAGVVDGDVVFDAFDEPLLSSPVVLCDERLPTNSLGKNVSGRLRSFIARGQHSLNPKGEKRVLLNGYPRLVVAINSLNELRFGLTAHTADDIAAVADRFLIINMQPESAALFDYRHFVEQGGLARHSAHLNETRPRKPLRFGVATGSYPSIAPLDALVAELAELVVARIVNPPRKPTSEKSKLPVFVDRRGGIWANVPALFRAMELTRTPVQLTRRRLTEAVRALSTASRAIQVEHSGGRENFWPLRVDILRAQLVNSEACDPADFEAALNRPTDAGFRSREFVLTVDDRLRSAGKAVTP
jgi:hypothetical protein